MSAKRLLWAAAAVAAVVGLVCLGGPRRAFADAVSAVIMRDADLPARHPFHAQIIVNLSNFKNQPVPIPEGKRLVVEYVTIAGGACCGIQPLILLNASVGSSTATTYYLQPAQSDLAQGQFYKSELVKIYADQLTVGFGWSGSNPNGLAANIALSGHLVDITPE